MGCIAALSANEQSLSPMFSESRPPFRHKGLQSFGFSQSSGDGSMAAFEARGQSLEQYFLRRLAEEAALAQRAPAAEREAHLRACALLRELLDGHADPDRHLARG